MLAILISFFLFCFLKLVLWMKITVATSVWFSSIILTSHLMFLVETA